MPKEKEGGEISIVPFEWAIKDLTQPTLQEMGLDLSEGYKALKEIATNAIKKNSNAGIANRRVAIEVLRSGGFAESDIAIEYFGGILASSKTSTGDDDSGIYYTDIIKSLSSKQLHLHYIVYNSLQKIFLKNPDKHASINIGMENELQQNKIFFSTVELDVSMKLELDRNIFSLVQAGLLHTDFKVDTKKIEEKEISYVEVAPRVLGVQLYAVSHNRLNDWRKYNVENFGDFEDIKLPSIFKESIKDIPYTNDQEFLKLLIKKQKAHEVHQF